MKKEASQNKSCVTGAAPGEKTSLHRESVGFCVCFSFPCSLLGEANDHQGSGPPAIGFITTFTVLSSSSNVDKLLDGSGSDTN